MFEKLNKATIPELQAWMWSAGIIGLGLGALLGMALMHAAVWILLIGLVVHIAAMVKIYSR